MVSVKFEEASEEAVKNEKLREVFEIMGGGVKLSDFKTIEAPKVRPFVPSLVWAYYSAYSSIVFNAVIQLDMLQKGIDSKYFNAEATADLVKAALPHQQDYIKKYGSSAFYYLLDELEVKLLKEIDAMFIGESTDRESLEKAANILRESERLAEINEKQTE